MRPLVLVLSLLILTLTAGCGAAGSVEIKKTIRDYDAENYKSVSKRCAGLKKKEASMNAKTQVNFRMYCGLAYWRLGKLDSAYRYLQVAEKFYKEGDPSWVSEQTVTEMRTALDQLEKAKRDKDDAEEDAPLDD